ncbi:MAG: GTP cyclohydrolase FolE2 [Thiomonas sp.]|jgi:GTP cyclohydrolase FolE2
MNAPEKLFAQAAPITLPDVQATPDRRNIAIQQVGVRGVRYPVLIRSAQGVQPSVGTFEMTVALPPEVKGTHMSRFIEILETHREPLDAQQLGVLLQHMLVRLQASEGAITARFTYFARKAAPVSGVESLMDYEVTLHAAQQAGVLTLRQTVQVPVTSLCPCSKEISNYGAHNQRSHVTIGATLRGDLGLDEQIRIAETAASCELWGLLKRPDEKYVTERAYDHPKFVEDLVRDVAVALERDDRVAAYTVESENFESIHNHSAYALVEGRKI